MLEYLLQRGEALKALSVLRRPGVSQELLYKFAPVCVPYHTPRKPERQYLPC